MIIQLFQGGRGRLIGAAAAWLALLAPAVRSDDALDRLAVYLEELEGSAWSADDAAVAAMEQRLRVRLVAALREGAEPSEGSHETLWHAYDRAVRSRIDEAEAEATLADSRLQDAEQVLPEQPTAEQQAFLDGLGEARRLQAARVLALSRERVWVADRLRTLRGRTAVHLDLWERCRELEEHGALEEDFDAFLDREGAALATAFRENERFPVLVREIFSQSDGEVDAWREHLARRLASLGPLSELGVPADVERSIRTARARELLEALDRLAAAEGPRERAERLGAILQADLVARTQEAPEMISSLMEHGLRQVELELDDWNEGSSGAEVQSPRIVKVELWEEDFEGGATPREVPAPIGSSDEARPWWLLVGERYRLSIEAKLERGGAASTEVWPLLVKIDGGSERARTISFPRFIPDGTLPVADAIRPSEPGILLTELLAERDFVSGFSQWLDDQVSLSSSSFRESIEALLEELRSEGSPALQEALADFRPGLALEELRALLRAASSAASLAPFALAPSPRYEPLLPGILERAPAGALDAERLTVLKNDVGPHLDVEKPGDPYGISAGGRLWFHRRRYDRDDELPLVFRLVIR